MVMQQVKCNAIGKVFLVREKKSRKEVALKVMFIRRFIENNIADQLRSEIEVRHSKIHEFVDSFTFTP